MMVISCVSQDLLFRKPCRNSLGILLFFQKFNEMTMYYMFHDLATAGPEVIKLFSCSTQLSMKFSPLINVKMPTIVGILTCMGGKNNILGLTEP